jgi:hypothetical protein
MCSFQGGSRNGAELRHDNTAIARAAPSRDLEYIKSLRLAAAHRDLIMLEVESCRAWLTCVGKPFVRFAGMFDAIFKLAVVALRQSSGDLLGAAGSILTA